jgi:hypothetical protein
MAFKRPSLLPDGLLKALSHWGRDCSPFIILPSYPFVEEVMRLEKKTFGRGVTERTKIRTGA